MHKLESYLTILFLCIHVFLPTAGKISINTFTSSYCFISFVDEVIRKDELIKS